MGTKVLGVATVSLALSLALGGTSACTKDAKAPTEPVAAAGGKNAAKTPEGAAPAGGKPAVAKAMPEDTCRIFTKLPGEPPVVLAGKNVVLTRFIKPCVTRDGKKGFEKTTPYLAMGFPCTGGSGRIEIRGHYANPKMVTFILGTDCGMAPAGKDQVQKLIGDTFDLPKEAVLAAYTPFVVQFWEIPGMSDADIGYALELRSAPAVEGLWRKFQKNEPVRVRLYGRENTWAQGDSVFYVEADLRMTGRTAFQLTVVQAKPLSKDEIAQVKGRCEALRPKRNCTDVF